MKDNPPSKYSVGEIVLIRYPFSVFREAWARGNGEHKFANPGGYMGKFEKLKQVYSL